MKKIVLLPSAALAFFIGFLSLLGTSHAVAITNTNTNTYTPSYSAPEYTQPYYPRYNNYSYPQSNPSYYYPTQPYYNGYSQYGQPQVPYAQYNAYPYAQSCTTYGQFARYNPQCTCPSGEVRNSIGTCVPAMRVPFYSNGREGCWTQSGRFSYDVDNRACYSVVKGIPCMWDEFRRCIPLAQNSYADVCTRIDSHAYYEYDSTDPGCYCIQGYAADSAARKCVRGSSYRYYEEWQRRLTY